MSNHSNAATGLDRAASIQVAENLLWLRQPVGQSESDSLKAMPLPAEPWDREAMLRYFAYALLSISLVAGSLIILGLSGLIGTYLGVAVLCFLFLPSLIYLHTYDTPERSWQRRCEERNVSALARVLRCSSDTARSMFTADTRAKQVMRRRFDGMILFNGVWISSECLSTLLKKHEEKELWAPLWLLNAAKYHAKATFSPQMFTPLVNKVINARQPEGLDRAIDWASYGSSSMALLFFLENLSAQVAGNIASLSADQVAHLWCYWGQLWFDRQGQQLNSSLITSTGCQVLIELILILRGWQNRRASMHVDR